MQRETLIHEAKELLRSLEADFRINRALRHQNINIEVEYLFRDLLNLVYGWNLVLANSQGRSQSSYDLIDTASQLVVQVTSMTSAEKVTLTVEGISKSHSHEVTKLKMVYPVMVKPKATPAFRKKVDTLFYDHGKDRIDLNDIAQEMQELETMQLEEAVEMLRRNLRVSNERSPAEPKASIHGGPPSIALVGRGFSAIATAIRILELAQSKLRLTLIHRDDAQYGGLAYSAATTGWEHLLNIQAGRISLYRERPADFLDWVNSLEAGEKEKWPEKWRSEEFNPSSAVPRQVYGQYLQSRLRSAVEASSHIVEMEEIGSEVESAEESPSGVKVIMVDASKRSERMFDKLVVCSGHEKSFVPESLKRGAAHEAFFDGPYSARFFEAARKIGSRDVLILGTGLSAYDAVLTLNRHGFKGRILMMSRNGLTHKIYPRDHIHEILPLPLPALPKLNLPARKMVEVLEREIARGVDFMKTTASHVSAKIAEERVLKSLEPWVARWVSQSDEKEVRDFLRISKSRLTTGRTGIVEEVGDVIRQLKRRGTGGKLEICKGEIVGCEEEGSHLKVAISTSPEAKVADFRAGMVVCCIGTNSDYTESGNPLWRNLLDSGMARVHRRTGRGVAVNDAGALIRSDGSVSERIFAVGPMRQGDEIERRGRLGAFVFSIGTIRNQALIAAITLLKGLETELYRELTAFERKRLEQIFSPVFGSQRTVDAKRLVDAVLAIRLGGLSRKSEALDHETLRQVDAWLRGHLEHVVTEASKIAEVDRNLIRHLVWYNAHLEAAEMATDITRLFPDHHQLSRYRSGPADHLLSERLACSSALKKAAAVFGAATGSLLIFSPEDRKLLPFAMHRRLESFTETEYGEGIAGSLIKSYLEGTRVGEAEKVGFCRDDSGRVVGVIVPNYNSLGDGQKKNSYVNRDRQFPSVMVAVLAMDSVLLGVAYIEADSSRVFRCEDVTLLSSLMTESFPLLREAQDRWDRDFRLSYQFGDFELADLKEAELANINLSQANFSGAEMARANLSQTTLVSTSFDDADMPEVRFERAKKIVGCSFRSANLTKAAFDGSTINHCNFSDSVLVEASFDGASISNCSFEGCDFSRTQLRRLEVGTLDFKGSTMRNCVLKGLTGVNKAKWAGVDLKGSRFDRQTWDALPELIKQLHAGSVNIES